mmetsp:Transcript_59677/g.106436  ORF Transcript_59677/g.106436 Transcript_59677/m.106436 type:complete len:574 (-) Transcript_59677:1496-3217(-)
MSSGEWVRDAGYELSGKREVVNRVLHQTKDGYLEKQATKLKQAKINALLLEYQMKRAPEPIEVTEHRVTPNDVYVGVVAGMGTQKYKDVGVRSCISLEQVLAEKMKREHDKYIKRDFQAVRQHVMDHPKYMRPKDQKVNPVVDNAIKKAKEVKEERVFEKPVSKFNKCVDLPSLGLMLQKDATEQDYNFAVQPNREREFLEVEQKKEQIYIEQQRAMEDPASKLDAFSKLPSTVLSKEPFLQFLYDKRYEEVMDVVDYQKQHPQPLPGSALTERYEEEGKQEVTQVPADGAPRKGSEQQPELPTPPRPLRAPVHSAGPKPPRGRAVSATVQRQTPDSLLSGRRPTTADAGSSRLFKNTKAKKNALQMLVSRQENQEAQLRDLMARQRQIQELQLQVEQLQREQQAQLRLGEGTGDAAVEVTIPPELDEQLRTLREQQFYIRTLHQQVLESSHKSMDHARLQRQEKVAQVQEKARLTLLESMTQHNHAEALARQRAHQRQQRNNALLWNRNRYESQRRPEPLAPPPLDPTAFQPASSSASDDDYYSEASSHHEATVVSSTDGMSAWHDQEPGPA